MLINKKTVLVLSLFLIITTFFIAQPANAEIEKLSIAEKDGFTIIIPESWFVLTDNKDLKSMFFGENKVDDIKPIILVTPDNEKKDTFYYIVKETKDYMVTEDKLKELREQTKQHTIESNPESRIINYGSIENNLNNSKGEYIFYKNNDYYQFVVYYKDGNDIISLSAATHKDNHPSYTDLFQYIALNLKF